MEDRRVINDSYFCGRFRPDGPVAVLTTTQYVVAEYNQHTGDIRWQRVVNASQKHAETDPSGNVAPQSRRSLSLLFS
jgi:hypothetical protein